MEAPDTTWKVSPPGESAVFEHLCGLNFTIAKDEGEPARAPEIVLVLSVVRRGREPTVEARGRRIGNVVLIESPVAAFYPGFIESRRLAKADRNRRCRSLRRRRRHFDFTLIAVTEEQGQLH